MKFWFNIILILVASCGIAAEQFLYTKNGSSYQIIISPDAQPVEKNAAAELQKFIKESSGIELPVVTTDRAAADTPCIFVGPAAARQRTGDTVNFAEFASDEIYQTVIGNDLILAGGSPRGTLYSVYCFLERSLGIRFLTKDDTHIPKVSQLPLPQETIRYAPVFTRRECSGGNGKERWQLAARLKLNGFFQEIPPEWGGAEHMVGHSHTFGQLINENQYFKDHPDWFSLNSKGQRVAGHLLGQLCLTNPEMRQEFLRKAIERMKPYWPRRQYMALSMNDNEVYCRCPNCAASDKRLGGPSDTLLDFVNWAAEELDREFPGIKVETLAYLYVAVPPKSVRPRKNVYIRLCSLHADFSKPINSDANAEFRDQLINWSKIAPGQLAIWHYVINFWNPQTVFPNTSLLAGDFRFFRDHGVTMSYAEGEGGAFGYMNELKLWLMSQVMWNPDLDGDALTAEFLNLYYGAAAPAMGEFIKLVDDRGRSYGKKIGCEEYNSTAWFGPDAIVQSYQLFDRAEKAVSDTPALLARVRKAKVNLHWACLDWLIREPGNQELARIADAETMIAAIEKQIELQPEKSRPAYNQYIAKFKRSLIMTPDKDPMLAPLVRGRKYMDLQDIFHYNGRVYGGQQADPLASDGFAARFHKSDKGTWVGGVFLWRPPVRNYVDLSGKRHFYITMRRDGGKDRGHIFSVAVWDRKTKTHGIDRKIDASEVGTDKYTVIDLGSSAVSNDSDIYMIFPNESGAASIWVDRVLMIEE